MLSQLLSQLSAMELECSDTWAAASSHLRGDHIGLVKLQSE